MCKSSRNFVSEKSQGFHKFYFFLYKIGNMFLFHFYYNFLTLIMSSSKAIGIDLGTTYSLSIPPWATHTPMTKV